ncbi:exo 1,3/1,4-beta-D-glucan glucohydrolase [Brevundimonas albigilva]|uniref:Exo 1,3/1,4-beta-D-glucan glucohydrolase n=1 Tax=Brevundimonas albigilva TaxID=1312364 RepID=A0ABY4SM24_9CAUL|nr:exo 1,3/1,4-beta-D-glucan glucohydrolase [Brevundimonas albigilva]UQV19783.1 exo 1,3/1,4-beta-D-glucan glucohydrolase [Brevundimonas albigilva]URI15972.1 exo 1,3/1,4-beta-D-glucan glucohydrolase [Brevundimonas albigilva]
MRNAVSLIALALAVSVTGCAATPPSAVRVHQAPVSAVSPSSSIVTEAGRAHPAAWPHAASPAAMSDAATEAFVTELMSRMTLEEKVGQTIQADIASITPEDLLTYPLGSILAGGNSSPGGDERASARKWVELAQAFRAAAARRAGAKIPLIYGIDAVHGHNNIVGATIFPHNSGLGAMRDPDVIRRIGEATALEVAVTGADWTFGPTLAVPQDDRWGRAYEGYAENPEVARSYAGPMTLGLQGELSADHPLASGHIAGSAKHFLADGGTTGGKDQGDFAGTERELIDVHLSGYPQAIDAGVLSIMASFSSWNGVKHSGNETILTDVLRGPLGFDGFVVSDWNAHGQLPGCSNESCALAFNAGIDMFMAPDSWKPLYENTLAQARSGEIPMARLDEAVRRILRVKVKTGLFQDARPVEGRLEELGSPAHRALAREAVRKSLVLLKNEGVLPIRSNARVLVAGTAADDIGQASGGWTLTWQGTGNSNADFPNGQSIWSGVEEAVRAGGGAATLSADGAYSQKPDVAIVVFGETPYAEFQGDVDTLDFLPSEPLETLRRLKAAGIPTVSVFLSGRPMWTNPEINASDAFVAAWLPGTEGGGVADVLIGDAAGKARHDFHGKLSFSWPRDARGEPLNVGQPGYDPQFAYGYGLSYARPGRVGTLSEESGVQGATGSIDRYFVDGRFVSPWGLALRDAGGERRLGMETSGASPRGGVAARPADGSTQESARSLIFAAGGGDALVSGGAVDLTRQSNGEMAISFRYRVDAAPQGPVRLTLGAGSVDVTRLLTARPVGEWATLKVRLSCLADHGADIAAVDQPWGLRTDAPFAVTVETIRLTPNEGDAVCPTGE